MTAPSLAAQQEEFMALLLDDARDLPPGLEAQRVAIYRNAYRARLIDALRETFPRTARWVGEEAFAQAAAHHVISFPPSSWTLDDVGKGFSDTLQGLFLKDPEVSELAWLEWAMHRCFVSYDARPLDAAGFATATAGFEDNDWATMRLRFMPGTQQASMAHRIDRLWRSLLESESEAVGEGAEETDFSSDEPLACVVWRQDYTPAVLPVTAIEGHALSMMLDGAAYGELYALLVDALGEEAAAGEAGAMLGRWLNHGMLVGISLGPVRK
ncbi:HvfC/BufC N-terminal domain-containing protein [Congregibacter litoralis]|uniref:Putative DNA-binding domain-containing protein n=1 Tax=Congregibacter litoralis KT71 TaxID=314285 RepID=A4ABR7_9GAMM|nr:DNA-binding domain-containing protein [Congregibacter litoralis]EAQ96580.1 hypothetical protein KT71_06132 [Congregibacter litoralis KT71]